MTSLVLVHRWLGIGFCLLFAMWFSTGIVMHCVPFPSLTESERFAGLLPIDLSSLRHGPDEAVAASRIEGARRVRLIQRIDGPVYLVIGPSQLTAVHAADLSGAAITSQPLALEIAKRYAQQRGFDAKRAAVAAVSDYDQWSVPGTYDNHRPLYRVALNDPVGTELYVSSRTGEVVLCTTRRERAWNYVGSVAHWIYPTVLRSHAVAWDNVVWALSLLASITAVAGVALGVARLQVSSAGVRSPLGGWHAWHHILGLLTATFVVTWIVSGWLSMDHGLLFSRDRLSVAEAAAVAGTPDWAALGGNQSSISAGVREVEWFTLGERFFKRERASFTSQSISAVDADTANSQPMRSFLSAQEVDTYVRRMASGCTNPAVIGDHDNYAVAAAIPDAPVFRSICGDIWFEIDGATGKVLGRLDTSRRVYRWAYRGLHTLDFPILLDYPIVRSGAIVALCAMGFLFSLTGAVIGWRRLRSRFRSARL
jgi:hypothetical protein